MIIDEHLIKHLKGNLFSNGFSLDLGEEKELACGRIEALQLLCTGKNIIHFGCADHIPLIDRKIERGIYLHQELMDVAKKVEGLDYNNEAISYIKEKHGYNNVHCYDLFSGSLPDEITDHHFDLVVMGEILEHVDNPVSFLETMKKTFSPYCDQIAITVPNIASKSRYQYILNNQECINSDHRYWFTPFTLAKVVTRAGMKLSQLHGSDPSSFSFLERLKHKYGIGKFQLNNCDTLIAICDLD